MPMGVHGWTAGWPAQSQAPLADCNGRAGERELPARAQWYRRSPGLPNHARCRLPGESILGKKSKYQTTKTLLLPRPKGIEAQQSSKSGQDGSKMRRRVGEDHSGVVPRASGGGASCQKPGPSRSRPALTLAAA